MRQLLRVRALRAVSVATPCLTSLVSSVSTRLGACSRLSAAGHDIHASYYNPAQEISGHPNDAYGFAVQGSLSIKNIPTGAGDSINFDAAFSNGATRYVLGGVSPNAFAMYGGTNLPGVYQSIGIGTSSDGVFTNGGQIEKTNAFGVRGAFNHNWNPNWSSSVFGSYTAISYSSNAKALYCAGFGAAIAGLNAHLHLQPELQHRGGRFPDDLDSCEEPLVLGRSALDGPRPEDGADVPLETCSRPLPSRPRPYEFKDQNTVVVGFRARRNF